MMKTSKALETLFEMCEESNASDLHLAVGPRCVSHPDALHVKEGRRAWFFRCDNPEGCNNMTFTGLPVTPGKRYVFKAHYYLDDASGRSICLPEVARGDRRCAGAVTLN